MATRGTDWPAELDALAKYLGRRPLVAVEVFALLERALTELIIVACNDPAFADEVIDDIAERMHTLAQVAQEHRPRAH